MPGYAIAQLYDVDLNAGIVEYLERIDSTLAPFGGKFLVHAGLQSVQEGPANAAAIVIEFPDYQAALDWYQSPAYQAILPLRTENASGIAILAQDCGENHVATDILQGRVVQG
ncbi:MAG: hypothetical protein JWN03_3593 [Nocardia sp.]|uniref:DUF1330 domain-containing protein n=1 Tax=Nocardia sp. TaxID=1821 RepID=UPI002605C5D7|nr:DUF1330 domain-containing protein [Nocardia sp.]MCU1643318.1 hypothetical protein [Nocardia sp.]